MQKWYLYAALTNGQILAKKAKTSSLTNFYSIGSTKSMTYHKELSKMLRIGLKYIKIHFYVVIL